MILEGDDRYIFGLFGKLVRELDKVGCLSRDAVNALSCFAIILSVFCNYAAWSC